MVTTRSLLLVFGVASTVACSRANPSGEAQSRSGRDGGSSSLPQEAVVATASEPMTATGPASLTAPAMNGATTGESNEHPESGSGDASTVALPAPSNTSTSTDSGQGADAHASPTVSSSDDPLRDIDAAPPGQDDSSAGELEEPPESVVFIDQLEDAEPDLPENALGLSGTWFADDGGALCRVDNCCRQQSDDFAINACAEDDDALPCGGIMEPAPGSPFVFSEPSDLPSSLAVESARVAEELGASNFLVRFRGRDYSEHGPGVGFTLNQGSAFPLPENVVGIRFLGVSVLGSNTLSVRVRDSSAQRDDGVCAPRTTCGEREGCFADFEQQVLLDDTWRLFEVRFDEMQPPDGGRYIDGVPPTTLARSQVYQISFNALDYVDFSAIGIDNVGFITR